MFMLQRVCFVRNLCNIEFGVRECAVLCWLPSSSSALPGLSSGGRWGPPVLPMCPLASEEKKKREREQLLLTTQPLRCHPPPSFLFSLRKGSTTPCQPIRTQLHPLHHIISVSKVTGRPLSLSLSLPLCFQTEKVPHHHHHPSHPSFHPTVPYWAGGYFSFSLSCVSIISVSLSLALFLQWDCHNINGTSLLLTLHPLTEKQRRKKWDGLKDEQRCGMYC